MEDSQTTTADLLAWFDRQRLRLWALIAVVYAAGFNGQWRIGADSAIHVTLARSLAEGSGYTHPVGLENTVQPGLAYLTAATFGLFGVDRFIAIDALLLLCAAAVLVTTFWLVRLRFDRPTAVVVVCMLAANELFFRYSYQVLTDMPFLLGLMLGLLGLELCRRVGAARWAGFALLPVSLLVMAAFRSVVLTVVAAGVLAAVCHLLCRPGRSRTATALAIPLTGGLLLAGWLAGGAATARDGGKALSLITGQSVGETLRHVFLDNGVTLVSENLPEAMLGVDLGPWAGAPLGIITVVLGVALVRTRPFWGMLVGVFVVQWLLFITVRRYSLTILPLLALGWWRLGGWLERRWNPAAARWAVVTLMVLWFAPNTVRVGAFVVQQRARPFLASYEDGRYVALNAVAHELNRIVREGDVIIADHAPQLTHLMRLPVFGPDTLPTYGPQREDTVERVRSAKRVLLVSPTDAMLGKRVRQLHLRQEAVLGVVPTPGYDRIDEYKIIQMWVRNVDWEKYRQRKQMLAEPPVAAEQRDGEAQKPAGEGEQPGDQTP